MSMLQTLNAKLDDVKNDIKELRDGYTALQGEVKSLREEVSELQRQNTELRSSNENLKKRMDFLEYKTDDLEGRSKRNNILFYGLARKEKETQQDCEDIVNDMIVDKLELTGDYPFDRVHRLNAKPNSPIIARCAFFKDKEKILKARYKLKGTQMFIGEDFSFRVREVRRNLIPHLKKAKAEGKRATLIFDHLLIEGKKYGLDDGHNLREIV